MDGVVDRSTVQKLGPPAHPLESESQSLGDRPTSVVVGGHIDSKTVESEIEQVIDDRGCGPGDEAPALELSGDPVPDLGATVGSMKSVKPDHAHDRGTLVDSRDDDPVSTSSTVSTLHRVLDEGQGVGGGPGTFDPGQSSTQSDPVLIDQMEDRLRMGGLHGFQVEVGSRFQCLDDEILGHRFDYTGAPGSNVLLSTDGVCHVARPLLEPALAHRLWHLRRLAVLAGGA